MDDELDLHVEDGDYNNYFDSVESVLDDMDSGIDVEE